MDTITETFNIILQKGIEGGFAAPTPRARYIITRAPMSKAFIVYTQGRPHGKPELEPLVDRTLQVADYVKSITRFQEIMRQIPTQYTGAPDLYGRNTSIVHVTDATKLADLHLYGSEVAKGIPYPTEEQKLLFDEAVTILDKWGDPKGPSE